MPRNNPGNHALEDYQAALFLQNPGRRDSFSFIDIEKQFIDRYNEQEAVRARGPICPGLIDQQYSYILMYGFLLIWEVNDPDPWPFLEELNAARRHLEELCKIRDIAAIRRLCAEWRVRKPNLDMRYLERSHCFRNASGGSIVDVGDARWSEDAR